MISRQIRILVWIPLLLSIPVLLHAQYIHRDLLLEQQIFLPGARASGIGTGFLGLVDDGTAILYNPASLTVIPQNDIGIHFLMTHSSLAVSWNSSNLETLSKSSLILGSIYWVGNYAVSNHRLSIGFGYFQPSAFSVDFHFNGSSPNFSGFSEQTFHSIAQSYLGLCKKTSENQTVCVSPDSLHQSYSYTEEIGLNTIAAAIAYDLIPTFSIGVSLRFHFGSIFSEKSILDQDLLNIYSSNASENYAFSFAEMKSAITEQAALFSPSISFAFLGRPTDNTRFGLQISLPHTYSISVDQSATFTVTSDEGQKRSGSPLLQSQKFSLTTSYRITGGIAYHIRHSGLSLTCGFEVTDPTLTQYSVKDGQIDVSREDRYTFSPFFSVGAGFEWDYPNSYVALRGGVSYQTGGLPEWNTVILPRIGLSFYFAPNMRIDLFANFASHRRLINYLNPQGIPVEIFHRVFQTGFQISYRY